ncbi:copper amine oxidase N-terminal domain-containing protein [Paenibacillus sp. PK4536]|uniref:copper amine oxidase N-terminal domain-containing protein n=1 Tax=Paenibacillus sp. PK4536 TaxID=3024576 RepID=UPI002358F7AD|nr:copper amine oxidase N-terminal domain-containing protein [Paenibacillus sp. PK4536]WIM40150.1 copper amine oxidase N-terminal domain-containing protein [Paenibacillus sp. PK4536]
MKKVFIVVTALLLFFSSNSTTRADVFDDSKVKVILDGSEIKFDPNAIIQNGNTMVPFRQLFEAYGASVSWNQNTKTITAIKDDKTIKLTLDRFDAYIDNKKIKLTQTPYMAKNTILVNLRFVSEALNAKVNFDKPHLRVTINRLK